MERTMDAVFEQEQEHLTETYAKLKELEQATLDKLGARSREAVADRAGMFDDLKHDMGNGVDLESYAELEAMQRLIDDYNLANDLAMERLVKLELLERRPYFAKIVVQLRPGAAPREVYLGATGMADERSRHFIVDWRAPIAEVYYNQSTGKTSYQANGRTVECDLQLRRQFDLEGGTLNACFDTTVAIEDPLLLASLAKGRSDKLSDITATIQREQNVVVRHEDVPVLLVNGIAGSGKTSVMLQRIAYLLFQERETLRPDQVHLISPNPVFRTYIDDVLPSMGERNPHIETWADLLRSLSLGDRNPGALGDAADLRRIDELLATFTLEARDFKDVCVDDEHVISAGQAFSAYQRYKNLPTGVHRCCLVTEDLHDKLEARIASRSHNEDVQGDLFDLPIEEQTRLFGGHIFAAEESELCAFTETYLRDRYRGVEDAIEDAAWLRIDRIGMRLLGKETLSAAEWLYLKLSLAGGADRAARFVMVDEVQDYSAAQLMVLARYFCNAHFLLLGDQNQAINQGTATFSQVKDVFESMLQVPVHECRLFTSYRSSPEITELFKRLMDSDARMDVSSVRRAGVAPVVRVCADAGEHEQAVRAAVEDAAGKEGLTAIICADERRAKALASKLANLPVTVPGPRTPLPEQGIVLLDVALAKGLEFDRVIIPDAQADVYDTSDVSRHRLYVAISRATQEVTLLACGALAPLLA